jgi:hypothetical protein
MCHRHAGHFVGQVVELVPAHGPEDGDVHTFPLQALHVVGVQLGRAVGVEDHVDLDYTAGALDAPR